MALDGEGGWGEWGEWGEGGRWVELLVVFMVLIE